MKEIYTHYDSTRVGYFKSLIENAGIPVFVRNQHADASMFGLVGAMFNPVLCVTNDKDYGAAKEIIDNHEVITDNVSDEEWECENCHSKNPANFASCWNCQNDSKLVNG